jgi:hypothetical protein
MRGILKRECAPQHQSCAAQNESDKTSQSAERIQQATVFERAQIAGANLSGQVCIALRVRPEQFRRQQQKFQQQRGHQCWRERINQQTPKAAAAPTPAAINTEFKGACWM